MSCKKLSGNILSGNHAAFFLIYLFSCIIVLSSRGYGQCNDSVDFNTWIETPSGETSWDILSPTEVLQATEHFPPAPSFFISQNEFINVRFSFDIISRNGMDNDFIGFVLGYRNPFSAVPDRYEFILFDWKAEAENAFSNSAQEGFTLAEFNGNIPDLNIPDYFWGHHGNMPNALYIPIAHSYGDTKGWISSRKYHFDVLYTVSSIEIDLDGNRLFTSDRCNKAGRFGFFTYSQHDVMCSDLSFKAAADAYFSPENICAGDTVYFSLEHPECPGYNLLMQDWKWDFGDGEMISSIVQGYHIYHSEGDYTIRMIAEFPGSCFDTVTRQIHVQPQLIVDLGHDTIVPVNSSLTLTAGPNLAGWSYLWSNGSVLNQSSLVNIEHDTLVNVLVSNDLCQAFDEISIKVDNVLPSAFHLWVPNAFSPDGNGSNDLLLPVAEDELQGEYEFYIYDRWGTELFRSTWPGTGWDGTYQDSPCPGDVYVYLLRYQPNGLDQTDSLIIRKGSFILLR